MLNRKKNRLTGYNYSTAGYYFVTLSTHTGSSLFGRLRNKTIDLTEIGIIVNKYLKKIPDVFKNVSLDEFIIMPDHLHVIISLRGANVASSAQTDAEKQLNGTFTKQPFVTLDEDRSKMLLSKVIQQFKRACTIEIKQKKLYRDKVWQRSFYDRVIRNEKELELTRKYIVNNPLKWQMRKDNITGYNTL
jgi:REP element-mobilizing transposase RayT